MSPPSLPCISRTPVNFPKMPSKPITPCNLLLTFGVMRAFVFLYLLASPFRNLRMRGLYVPKHAPLLGRSNRTGIFVIRLVGASDRSVVGSNVFPVAPKSTQHQMWRYNMGFNPLEFALQFMALVLLLLLALALSFAGWFPGTIV